MLIRLAVTSATAMGRTVVTERLQVATEGEVEEELAGGSPVERARRKGELGAE